MDRIEQLATAFAVDVYAYSIMSNHFHLVVYYDPGAAHRWTDLEVARRWLRVCPPKQADGSIDEDLRDLQMSTILSDRTRLSKLREKLGSVSYFMKFLKQPIARRANLEDDCKGHFFEQRFYSGALLTDEAVLAAMAYVDLNPVRAKIAQSIAEADHTSIHARLMERHEPLDAYLQPLFAGVGAPPILAVTLNDYVESLEVLLPSRKPRWSQSKVRRWHQHVSSLQKPQRMFGSESAVRAWSTARGWRLREAALSG